MARILSLRRAASSFPRRPSRVALHRVVTRPAAVVNVAGIDRGQAAWMMAVVRSSGKVMWLQS